MAAEMRRRKGDVRGRAEKGRKGKGEDAGHILLPWHVSSSPQHVSSLIPGSGRGKKCGLCREARGQRGGEK